MIRSLVSTIILAVFLAGCGDGTGPESGTRVTIGFTAGSSAAQTSGAQAAPRMVSAAGVAPLDGNNGILTLTDVWMILAEFELEKASGSCALDPDMHCHDFEVPPALLHLPMDGGIVEVVTESEVPDGSYDELEFEVEDLLDDDDDATLIQAVRDQILAALITDWPDEASMLVEGTFRPKPVVPGVDPIPFRVYFDAEIEIEIEFDEILEIPTVEGDLILTVDVQPDLWFMLPDGDVLDLSQFDWDDTMELLDFEFEFESEFEDGFAEIEIEIG